jgi:hypothetical protein
VSNIPGNHEVKELQKTAILGTAHLDHTVSASVTEVSEIYKDFLDMVEEMRNMYRRNDFYLRDILPYASKFV